MSKKKEIQNVLKAEITLAARKLLHSEGEKDFKKLLEEFEKLYGKLAAYRYIEENFADEISKIEDQPAPAVEPESSGMQEKPVSGKQSYISASGEEETKDTVQKKKIRIEPSEKERIQKASVTGFKPKSGGKRWPELQIGLADKIAFLKNFFENDVVAYEEFITRLNRSADPEEAFAYFKEEKKRRKWKGKEEYENRLIQIIQARFQS